MVEYANLSLFGRGFKIWKDPSCGNFAVAEPA